jgi:hypothetical protein
VNFLPKCDRKLLSQATAKIKLHGTPPFIRG